MNIVLVMVIKLVVKKFQLEPMLFNLVEKVCGCYLVNFFVFSNFYWLDSRQIILSYTSKSMIEHLENNWIDN